MKILLILLLLATPALAQTLEAPLTDEELIEVRSLLTKTSQIDLLIANPTLGQLEIELKQLEQDRLDLIAERDALLTAEDEKNQAAKQIIITTYEESIDSVEADITAKRDAIDDILSP